MNTFSRVIGLVLLVIWAQACSSKPADKTPPVVCGDKAVQGAEACDDGNTTDGDGCGATCTLETGWSCSGAPSSCQPVCGDGQVVGSEACDDGKTEAGDGCSATCTVETGYTCSGTPSACHTKCGDGIVAGVETCDDGDLMPGDGCDATCVVESGWDCNGAPSVCATVCGDSIIAGKETCDDGDSTSGNGCDENCAVEQGWDCQGVPSVCQTVCGDGLIAGTEECDDDGKMPGDGCDGACKIEQGWKCNDAPSVCATVCGDGLIRGKETCDDADGMPGNGCSDSCTVEPGWTCTGAPSTCTTTCGDGIIVAGKERCDDGNPAASGDGCDVNCAIETGWICGGTPSTCATSCGDHVTAGIEECDDGNPTSFDGCNPQCQVDVFTETEPNNTTPQANGPWSHSVLLHGAIQPAWDVDTYAVVLTSPTDLWLETTDDKGTCLNLDTVLTLLAPDGTTVVAADDDAGTDRCSKLDGRTDARLQHLAPGTYFVQVSAFNSFRAIPAYNLAVHFVAVCGDAVREGSEQCDGLAGCDATCHRVPTCNDGFVDASETCDDGNNNSGDGCSATCQFEPLTETEANNTAATASGPYAHPVLLAGAISPGTDVDYFAITLPATTDLRIDTFDANGPGSCIDIDTVVTLYGTDGSTVLLRKDQGGLANCGAIDSRKNADAAARHLPAGTYYVRVEDYLNNSSIAGYHLLVTYNAVCGNGVVEGSEECDGGAGCKATCDRVPSCGDGFVDAPETCDDGNLTSGDGCSAACASEAIAETEPNENAPSAEFYGARTGLFRGAISPATDVDYFAFNVLQTSDVVIETFDANGPGHCNSAVDTVLTLYGTDGYTVLATRDDGGIGTCSRIDPKSDVAARRLPPGEYFVKVEDFENNNVINGYMLSISFAATCGNALVEGYEQCDGGPGCTATCEYVQVCGDGFIDGAEMCDDGNTTSGDGCSATCQIEAVEAEPNDTRATGTVAITGHGWVQGAISPVGDKDFYPLTLPQSSVLQLTTYDATAAGCSIATTLRLFDSSGTQLYADDNSGVSTCSSLVVSLPTGTYYVSVEGRGNSITVPSYYLSVTPFAGSSSEVEPNELIQQATAETGINLVILGSHQSNTDSDFFSFNVPEGRSVRAEIIEGSSAETCESNGIDSALTLYAPGGQILGWDDDSGRGSCSRIDGTGQNADSPFASLLPAGTYSLQVEAAPFTQMNGNQGGQFDYRLVISIR